MALPQLSLRLRWKFWVAAVQSGSECIFVSCHPVVRVKSKYLKSHAALQQNLPREIMYILVIGWLYVALMMAVAEATNANGTVLGAIVTFLLYGVGPLSLVVYLMLEPARRRRRNAAAQAEQAAHSAALGQPDGGGEAAADAVAPVREKP
jgi:hypothetical protein